VQGAGFLGAIPAAAVTTITTIFIRQTAVAQHICREARLGQKPSAHTKARTRTTIAQFMWHIFAAQTVLARSGQLARTGALSIRQTFCTPPQRVRQCHETSR